jgi:hypothetical protein
LICFPAAGLDAQLMKSAGSWRTASGFAGCARRGCGGFRTVAGEGGIDDGLVFGMNVPGDGLAEQGQSAVALGLVVQDVLEVTDPARGQAPMSAS